MTKKHLEPLANSDDDDPETIFGVLREYGATEEMFEYLLDTFKAQRDRYGPLKMGFGLGIDRDAHITHSETKVDIPCELIVFHIDIARESKPEEAVNRVVIGFMLKDGKIDQLVKMS